MGEGEGEGEQQGEGEGHAAVNRRAVGFEERGVLGNFASSGKRTMRSQVSAVDHQHVHAPPYHLRLRYTEPHRHDGASTFHHATLTHNLDSTVLGPAAFASTVSAAAAAAARSCILFS